MYLGQLHWQFIARKKAKTAVAKAILQRVAADVQAVRTAEVVPRQKRKPTVVQLQSNKQKIQQTKYDKALRAYDNLQKGRLWASFLFLLNNVLLRHSFNYDWS